jgi:hypothetical protein
VSREWPLWGEYSLDVIAAALEAVPGVSNLRPGELDSGGPVVRFDVDGGRAGAAGCFKPGEYLVVVCYLTTDNDPGTGHPVSYGHRSRRLTRSADIRFAVGALKLEVMPRA